MNATESYWEQSRQAVRQKVVETGMRLFLEQGFDETTTAQIAKEVGISSRSLFRYVATKEDVVLGHLEPQGDVIAAALAHCPAGESVWAALRAALDSLRGPGYDEQHQLKLMKMIYASPSLRARYMDKRMAWIELLSPEIARRLAAAGEVPEQDLELASRAVVATALTCLTLAAEAWTAQDGALDLGALYDTAITAVRGQV